MSLNSLGESTIVPPPSNSDVDVPRRSPHSGQRSGSQARTRQRRSHEDTSSPSLTLGGRASPDSLHMKGEGSSLETRRIETHHSDRENPSLKVHRKPSWVAQSHHFFRSWGAAMRRTNSRDDHDRLHRYREGDVELGVGHNDITASADNECTPETRRNRSRSSRLSSDSSVSDVGSVWSDPRHDPREAIRLVRESDIKPFIYRQSPWKLMRRDLLFFMRHWRTIPRMFGGEDGPRSSKLATVGHIVMVVVSLLITILCIAALITSVGFLIIILYVFAWISHRFQGPRTLDSIASRTLRYGAPVNSNCSSTPTTANLSPPNVEREKWLL